MRYITILIGLTAIIDNDIKHQIKDATRFYNIQYVRINLSQVSEIINKIIDHDEGEILIISRGGGENIQLFNNTEIAETVLTLSSIFVTAIGHSDDEPLLQKVADKAFITPTSLGQFLYDTYISTTEEYNHSRGKMIDDLTKQIELSYQHRLTDLTNRLTDAGLAYRELARNTEIQQQHLSHALSKAKRSNSQLAILLILIIAFLVMYFVFGRK